MYIVQTVNVRVELGLASDYVSSVLLFTVHRTHLMSVQWHPSPLWQRHTQIC